MCVRDCIKGTADKTHSPLKSKADRDEKEKGITTLQTNSYQVFVFIAMVRYPEDQQENIKHQELSHTFLFPSTRSSAAFALNTISYITPYDT